MSVPTAEPLAASVPVQVTFRHLAPSDSIEAFVRERAAKLAAHARGLTRCHVVVDGRHGDHEAQERFRVHVEVARRGCALIASHFPCGDPNHGNAFAAIDRAFECVTRQLERNGRHESRGERVRLSDLPLCD